jgi:hypothetical protein
MPTRLIREGILSSSRVDELDPPAEVFYRRLLSKVDDHGLFDARPTILRAALYPLRVDRVREADISRHLRVCKEAGLIVLYEAVGKPYLKILDTRWTVRSEPKYPPPNEQLQTGVNNCFPSRSRCRCRRRCLVPPLPPKDGVRSEGKTGDSQKVKAKSSPVKSTDTKDLGSVSSPRAATPKAEQPHQTIVNRYLELKGTPRAELTQKQITAAYKRHARSALALITEAGGLNYARAALETGAEFFDQRSLNWTIDTIAKHLPDIKKFGREITQRRHNVNPKVVDFARELASWVKSKNQTGGLGTSSTGSEIGVSDG